MKSRFGEDGSGAYKRLEDGRVLRLNKRLYNTLLTVSPSVESLVWDDGW